AIGWRPARLRWLLWLFIDRAEYQAKNDEQGLRDYVNKCMGGAAGVEALHQEVVRLLEEETAAVEAAFEEEVKAQEEKDAIERDACLAPAGETWEMLARQEMALDRSIDRKVKILQTMRKEHARECRGGSRTAPTGPSTILPGEESNDRETQELSKLVGLDPARESGAGVPPPQELAGRACPERSEGMPAPQRAGRPHREPRRGRRRQNIKTAGTKRECRRKQSTGGRGGARMRGSADLGRLPGKERNHDIGQLPPAFLARMGTENVSMELSPHHGFEVLFGDARCASRRTQRSRFLPPVSSILVAVILLLAAGSPIFAETPRPTSVILISVDTLRADHLGCYGYRALATPHIDAIARGATQFMNAGSQVPLTLPSHVSLLTSTYPFANGVEDNGDVLGQGAVTLASLLGSRGYRTAAFIGGFPLDRRFGLDQGFEVYDSPFDLSRQQDLEQLDVKRPAGEVTQAATRWLQANSDHPFFLFLHLYDLHKPYTLTADQRARFRNREYDGVLGQVDAALGEWWSFLTAKGLVDRSLIVFLSDHGESLGEHGERTHGYFIYESTLRVPLIIHWPRAAAHYPSTVDAPVGLIDVAPTILQFLGLREPSQYQGRSLFEMLEGKAQPAPRELYAESLYAHDHYGCSALRSVRLGNFKYIEAPEPELYDLAADPAERSNLYGRTNSLALAYRERLEHLRGRFAAAPRGPSESVSPEVARALRSLGYTAGTAHRAAAGDSGPDPKLRVDDYLKTEEAVTLSFAGQLAQSVALLREVLAKDPDLIDSRNLRGLFEQRLGRREEAAESFRRVLERDPTNLLAHYNLGALYFQLNRLDDAARELQATLAIGSGRGAAVAQLIQPSEEMLGKIWLEKGDLRRARDEFSHLLTVFPRDFAAHYNLGWIASEEKNWEEATRHLQAALEIEPDNSRAHNALGTVKLQQGDYVAAKVQFSAAIKLDPKYAQAYYDLGMALRKTNQRAEAVQEFKKALEVDPKFLPAQQALEEMKRHE
ncbi:MAG: sulfatase-like hydrolase/transferase, partial [Terriglobia bacterium]